MHGYKSRSMVLINGKAVELNSLPDEEKKRLAENWSKIMAATFGYEQVKGK